MINNDIVKKCFFDIIPEAKKGLVNLKTGYIYIKFDTALNDLNIDDNTDTKMPVLKIKNIDELLNLLNQYIYLLLTKDIKWGTEIPHDDLYDFIKRHICYLFANGTYDDYNNPEKFVQKYIDFINDDTFENISNDKNIEIENLNAKLRIKRIDQPVGQETPYTLDITLEREINGELYQYHLPYLRYGVQEIAGKKNLYLYAIQNGFFHSNDDLNANTQMEFNKNINKKLYKLNKNVNEDNLLSMSPSFVLVETILIALMKINDIDTMYIAESLPQKLYMKDQIYGKNKELINKLSKSKLQSLGLVRDVESLKTNMTEHFVNTTKRIGFHMSGMDLTEIIPGSFIQANINFNDNTINNELMRQIYQDTKENANNLLK